MLSGMRWFLGCPVQGSIILVGRSHSAHFVILWNKCSKLELRTQTCSSHASGLSWTPKWKGATTQWGWFPSQTWAVPAVPFQARFRAHSPRAMGQPRQGTGSTRLTALTQSTDLSQMPAKIKLRKNPNTFRSSWRNMIILYSLYTYINSVWHFETALFYQGVLKVPYHWLHLFSDWPLPCVS